MAAFSHSDDLAGNKCVLGFSRSHQRKKNTILVALVRNPLPASQPVRRGAPREPPDSQVGFNFQPTGTEKSFHSRFVFHLYRH